MSTNTGLAEDLQLEAPSHETPPADGSEAVIRSLRRYACLLHVEERYEEAEEVFRKVVDLEPDNGRYTLELAWTVFKNRTRPPTDRLMEAAEWLLRAVRLMPNDPQVRYCNAVYFMEAGNVDRCESELKAALRTNPEHEPSKRALERIQTSRDRAAEEEDEAEEPFEEPFEESAP